MKNPCKKCLVMMICVKPCDDLNAYAKVIVDRENLRTMPAMDSMVYKYWMENIEIRPALKQIYESMKKKDEITLIRQMK
jgi:hypothetical protein